MNKITHAELRERNPDQEIAGYEAKLNEYNGFWDVWVSLWLDRQNTSPGYWLSGYGFSDQAGAEYWADRLNNQMWEDMQVQPEPEEDPMRDYMDDTEPPKMGDWILSTLPNPGHI